MIKEQDMETRQHIVVIGGGFAGLNLVKHLDVRKFRVTLIDRNNYHAFPPLFYQIASSGIEPLDITFPFRKELKSRMKRGVRYVLSEVSGIDTVAHEVITDTGRIGYDRLVIAAGTTNNYFGNDALRDRVYTLKSTSEAIRCRNDILKSLELAARETDEARRRRLLSFVVIGGGPAGVEVAGALGEMKRYILKREYPDLNPDEMSITIVERTHELLRTMTERSSADAAKALEQLCVTIRLGHNMSGYDGNTVTLDDGTVLPAGMVIWTAGVVGEPLTLSATDVAAAHGGRFVTDRYNHVKGLEDIYAIGDIALVEGDDKWPKGHPQLAQVAIQQSRNLARNFNSGVGRHEFKYKDKGAMATIGRNRAVVDLGGAHLSGWIAWMMWMAVHLLSLLGMRNRLSVLTSWVWSYFTYTAGTRVLVRESKSPAAHRL